jgi:hypothetical protein
MARKTPHFTVDDDVDVAKLVEGVQIDRHTEAIGSRRDDPRPAFVNVPAPCCGRMFRKVATSYDYAPLAFCCLCQLVFRLELIDENDGGYLATFTVEEPGQVVVASHRRPAKSNAQ